VKLVLVALSLMVGLTICEAIIRIFVGVPLVQRLPVMEIRANPNRGWGMVPGQTHYTHHYEVRVNSFGLRGPEFEPRRDGEIRVLALGDSMTYGQGVADDETLPHYLETILQKRDPLRRPWTVVNAGHRGYNTSQEIALLMEFGEVLKPDVVVVLWYWNDLHEFDIDALYRSLKGRVTLDTSGQIKGWGWERVKWEGLQLLRRSALIMYVHDALRDIRTKPMEVVFVEEGFEQLGRHLDRLVEIAGNWQFRPVFAVVPDPNVLVGSHESEAIDERAMRLASERNIPTVRLIEPLAALYKRTRQLPLVPFDGHYSAEANLGMAEVIADVLLRAAGTTIP
jgi:GDSL-like Lipase/Acylhydrolase family